MLFVICHLLSYIICHVLNIGNNPHAQPLGNKSGKLGYIYMMKYYVAIKMMFMKSL